MSKTVVGNTNLATVAANSVKGNPTAAIAQPTDLVLGTNQFVGNIGNGLAAVTLTAGSAMQISTVDNVLTFSGPGRNKLINGDMRIWQRGTSFVSTAGYTADRWYVNSTISNPTVSRSTDVPTGFQYSLNASATNTDVGIFQRIESVNALDLVNDIVTVSFWAKQTTGAGTNSIGVQLYYPNTADVFTSTTSIQTILKTGTTSWAYYTATFNALPANVVNGLQLQVFSTRSGGTGNSVLLVTGLQLEVGPTATPFEYRPIGTELALCQRYYCKTYNTNVSPGTITEDGALYAVSASTVPGTAYVNWNFPCTMRTYNATILTYNPVTGLNTNQWRQSPNNIPAQNSYLSDKRVLISNAATVTANGGMIIHATAAAEL